MCLDLRGDISKRLVIEIMHFTLTFLLCRFLSTFNNTFPRYCGEMSSLALTSTNNVLDVTFHSDESFTDKGFSAEYSAYDPSDRELKVLSHNYPTFGEMGEML